MYKRLMQFILTTFFLFTLFNSGYADINNNFIRIPLHASSVSLNPSVEQDFSSLWVSRQVNCQLIRIENGDTIMDAAQSINFISPIILDVKIKNNITFNNGKSLTADDVIASLNYLKKNRVILRNALNWIKSIKKINNYEIQITLKKAYPQFLTVFSAPNYSIFSKEFLENSNKDSSIWNYPITCGAYYVKKYTDHYIIILPRYEGYPIKFYFLPNGYISAEEAKKYDLILLEIKNPELLSKDFNTIKIFDPFQFLFVPNTRKYPWNIRKNRCALLSKIDPSSIMAAYGDSVKPATDLLPTGTLGYKNSNYQNEIEQEGKNVPLPKLNSFCFSFFDSSIEKNIRGDFNQLFSKLFPNVTMAPIFNSVHMAKKFEETNCDGIILSLKSNYLDAYEYLLIFSENDANVSGYRNKQLTYQIENSQTLIQPSEMYNAYRHIISELRQQCLVYPLFTMPYEKIYLRKTLTANKIGITSLNDYLLTNLKKYD